MPDAAEVRRLALALPEAVEQPHHARTSFRVGGKIFATMTPGEGRVNLALPPELAIEMLEREPEVLAPINWGSIRGWVCVDLEVADSGLLEMLIHAAWTRVAPRPLTR